MPSPQSPHIIRGTITTRGGNPVADTLLLITNTRNGDTITGVSTNALGQYVFDCNNFTNDYANNDYISIELNPDYEASDFTLQLSADGGDNWETVTNDTEHTFTNTGDTLKIKITASNTSYITRYTVDYTAA